MTNEMVRNASLFLAGALLGGAVATLVTPWSGRRFRTLVRRKVEDGVDQLSEVKENLRHVGEEIRSRSETLARGADGIISGRIFG